MASAELLFDFSASEWIDLFALAILALWIAELNESGERKIGVAYPRDVVVASFLDSYGFTEFLDSKGIPCDRIDDSVLQPTTRSPEPRPFFPLTFFDHRSFQEILSQLSRPERIAVLLSDIAHSELVSSGAVRDVLLGELGDNALRHANGRFGLLSMSKLSVSANYRRGKAPKAPIERAESDFLVKLRGDEYVVMVLADKGPGIVSRLGAQFRLDRSLTSDSQPACDILKYAFEYHSSSRSQTERLGSLASLIRQENPKTLQPPSGLYRLLETVRYFRGFLYVRSSDAILAYDFSQKESHDPVLESCRTGGIRRLARFGGTQFKVILPASRERTSRAVLGFAPYDSRKLQADIIVEGASVAALSPTADLDHSAEAAALMQLRHVVNEARARRLRQPFVNVIDCTCLSNYSEKARHYAVYDTLLGVQPNEICVFINVEHIHINALLLPTRREFLPRLAFLVAVDGSVHLVNSEGDVTDASEKLSSGADAATRLLLLLQSVMRAPGVLPPAIVADFIGRVTEEYASALQAQMSRLLMSPGGVFDPDIQVHLPSEAYCRGFFDLSRLEAGGRHENILRAWVNGLMLRIRPTHIVLLGRLIRATVEAHVDGGTIVPVAPGLASLAQSPALLAVPADARVLVATDVVGSGRTVGRAREFLRHVEHLTVAAIVDASVSVVANEALVRHPLQYWDERPDDWDYNDIARVHRDSGRVERPKALEVLWRPELPPAHRKPPDRWLSGNLFLDHIVVPSGAIIRGHFSHGDRHFTYLFNIPRLIHRYGPDIASVIQRDVGDAINRPPNVLTVTHVICAAYNPGIAELGRFVASRWPSARLVALSRPDATTLPAQSLGPADVVVVLDDAMESGHTMLALLDVAARLRANHVCAYITVRRGTIAQGRRIQGITRFGDMSVRIRFLAEAELPSFSAHSCPVCFEVRRWGEVKEQFARAPIIPALAQSELGRLKDRTVAVATKEQMLLSLVDGASDDSMVVGIRWQIEKSLESLERRNELFDALGVENFRGPTFFAFVVALHQERLLYRFNKEGVLDSWLRPDVRQQLVESLRAQVERIGSRPSHVEALLYCSTYVDEFFLLKTLRKLLTDDDLPPEIVARVLAFIVREPAFNRRHNPILFALDSALEKMAGLQDTRTRLLREAKRYFQRRQEGATIASKELIADYVALTGGLYHEIGHLQDNLQDALRNGESQEIGRAWEGLRDEIQDRILPPIQAFSERGRMSSALQGRLRAAVEAVILQIEQSEPLVRDMFALDAARAKAASEGLRIVSKRLVELLFGATGVRPTVMEARQNVKRLLGVVLDRYQKAFEEAGITVQLRYAEEACIVFAEQTPLSLMLANIVENVIRHSKAQTLRVVLRAKKDQGLVLVQFYDDGQGVRQRQPFGDGLQRSMEYAEQYGGALVVNPVNEGESMHREKFKSKAIIRLARLDPGAEV